MPFNILLMQSTLPELMTVLKCCLLITILLAFTMNE